MWSPLRVEHYKFATLHRNYDQNPMKATHLENGTCNFMEHITKKNVCVCYMCE
jgi:hypothetical protein